MNVLARHVGARVVLVDMGVAHDFEPREGLQVRKIARGTANLFRGPAMTAEQAVRSLEEGIAAWRRKRRRAWTSSAPVRWASETPHHPRPSPAPSPAFPFPWPQAGEQVSPTRGSKEDRRHRGSPGPPFAGSPGRHRHPVKSGRVRDRGHRRRCHRCGVPGHPRGGGRLHLHGGSGDCRPGMPCLQGLHDLFPQVGGDRPRTPSSLPRGGTAARPGYAARCRGREPPLPCPWPRQRQRCSEKWPPSRAPESPDRSNRSGRPGSVEKSGFFPCSWLSDDPALPPP